MREVLSAHRIPFPDQTPSMALAAWLCPPISRVLALNLVLLVRNLVTVPVNILFKSLCRGSGAADGVERFDVSEEGQ